MPDLASQLRMLRESLGKSQAEMAGFVGIPQKTWSNYETGKTEPPMKVLFALAEKGYRIEGIPLGLMDNLVPKDIPDQKERERIIEIAKSFPPDMPLDDFRKAVQAVRDAYDLQKKAPIDIYHSSDVPANSFVVPLLDQRLSAGPGAYVPEVDEPRALVAVPLYLSRYGKDIAALTVDGDSMAPTLKRGDMVVCDSLGWSGEGIYAVRMGGSGFVKRITKAPGKIVILSDNPKYPPREEPEGSTDFQIIGRVHCAITKVE